MSRTPSRPSIKIPDKATLTGLARSLKLGARQVTVLEHAIRAAEWDERVSRAMRLPAARRRRKVKSIKAMNQHLVRLLYVMDQAGPDLDDMLPRAAQDVIVEAISISAKQALLGPVLRHRGARSSPRWESLALSHPGLLLKTFLEHVQAPIRSWMELDKLNKGGRPADLPRTLVVCSLVEACPELLGRQAPISTTGSFVRFCAEVIVACGLDDTGIDKLVPKVVRRLRKQSKNGAEGQKK